MDFKSSRPALTAVEVRADGAGAKAAADPITVARRESFMLIIVAGFVSVAARKCHKDLTSTRKDYGVAIDIFIYSLDTIPRFGTLPPFLLVESLPSRGTTVVAPLNIVILMQLVGVTSLDLV